MKLRRFVLMVMIVWALAAPMISPAQTRRPAAAPALTVERLAALRKVAMVSPESPRLNSRAATIFGLTKGGPLDTKGLAAPTPKGPYFLNFSLTAGTDDVVFVVAGPPTVRAFLTNSRLVLRAAAVQEQGVLRLITNEQAAAGFADALKTWSVVEIDGLNKLLQGR
jgi:hypothetical protein